MSVQIAIDGPAGAGKSTIAKIISKDLGFLYLDTGAMYRSFGLFALNKGVDCSNAKALISILDNFNLDIVYENGVQQLVVNNENVTSSIRTPEVSLAASLVAVVPAVRLKLVELQRKIAEVNSVVMDGRDIGSYVLPNANIKIFLTATVDDRAMRRLLEMQEKGDTSVTFESVKKDMEFRDNNDSSRAFAPLIKADDAIEVNTTGFDLDQSIGIIKSIVEKRLCCLGF